MDTQNVPTNIQMYQIAIHMSCTYVYTYISDSPFKANCLHLKELHNKIREPPYHTGNEPILDIPIGGSEHGKKFKMINTCYL